MESYLISDNQDTLVGMRLCGISGVVLKNRKDILDEFNLVLKNKEIGILILTEGAFKLIKDEVMNAKLKRKFPLIVEIPDSNGTMKDKDFITRYINESVGISI